MKSDFDWNLVTWVLHYESLDGLNRLFLLASFDAALEKEMATHSSVLAWRIPGTEEPGGLPSLWSHRVGHDWSNLAAAARISKVMFKILQARPQQYMNHEIP